MFSPTLLEQTQAHFPDFRPDDIAVTQLEKGGSDRKFYRVDMSGGTDVGKSLILVKYSDQRAENRHYVDVAKHLADRGLNVPQIYHHDPAEGLIWMQDLGETDLWTSRAEPWSLRRPLYEKTLAQAARLHALSASEAEASLSLQPGFDARLYEWEQNYFFEHCLSRHFSIEHQPEPVFGEISERLARLPRVLVHRDFQSQNIMILEDDAWLIDFQGLRPGLRQYDLASLLYDPYVDLNASERTELLDTYQQLSGVSYSSSISRDEFLEIFHLCALQRLLQALGAYGFLGHTQGKPAFLRHIPQALASLREVAGQIDGLRSFARLLDTLPS